MTRLEFLEAEIPVLESKLREMKRQRRSLKASLAMRAKRRDPAFEARAIAAVRRYWTSPEGRERFLQRRWRNPLLPWPQGTRERNSYRCLRLKGRNREEAIAEVQAGFRSRRYVASVRLYP